MPRKSRTVLSDVSRLQGFKLLERFREVFAGLDAHRTKSPRELDPRRKFDAADYFSMILFTLLNPLVDTMRGLYEALHPDEYQRRTRLPKVSLGRLFEPGVGGAKLVAARECERSFLRYGLLEPGVIYVNPLFPFPDRLPSVFSALGEKAIS